MPRKAKTQPQAPSLLEPALAPSVAPGGETEARTLVRPARPEPVPASPPAPPPLAAPAAAAPPPRPPSRAPKSALKSGMGLKMLTPEGEESVTPFRSLEDLLSAIKPILRGAARSPEPVWFAIEQIDLAAIELDL